MKIEESMKLDSQLCFPLYAAARKITGLYTPYLKPLGITYTQYIMFLVLWEKDGITVGELCKRLRLDTGTVTPMLKNTEKQGLIRRTRSEDDERVVVISLTEDGKDLYKKARKIPSKIGSCVKLEKEEAIELYRILYKLLEE
ncbi:MAG: MarR family transcriptional regulator [Clostridiales bacterium]|nr:MarR family transcriptional regulator [Clostridiales bacterium]